MKKSKKRSKVLFIDIETAPLLVNLWGIFDQTAGLSQIKTDWHVLSFAAKWQGSEEIIYFDQRKVKNIENDKFLLKKVWKLLNAADVVIGHNSKRFDIKKLNARFIGNGLPRPAPFQQVDTLLIARKHFSFTSNKLEYLSGFLCPHLKKSSHIKYPGFVLWRECLNRKEDAFKEMEKYNKQDIVALEGVYKALQQWDNTVNLHNNEVKCNCGSEHFQKRGFSYTKTLKYQRFQCTDCGAWFRGNKALKSDKPYISI